MFPCFFEFSLLPIFFSNFHFDTTEWPQKIHFKEFYATLKLWFHPQNFTKFSLQQALGVFRFSVKSYQNFIKDQNSTKFVCITFPQYCILDSIVPLKQRDSNNCYIHARLNLHIEEFYGIYERPVCHVANLVNLLSSEQGTESVWSKTLWVVKTT